MNTAIITGASSGLGRELALRAAKEFPAIERFVLIARRRDRLEETARRLEGKKVVVLALDLCNEASFGVYAEFLKENAFDVRLLINCSGCGYIGNVGEGELELQTRMVDLNVRALTAVTHMTIPYMHVGARIINISSIASFCPNARMSVYSSTKAYVSSFSRGVGEELRRRGIIVTAVCPGPMMTEFLGVGGIVGNSKMFASLPYCEPKKVAAGAIAASKAHREVYTPRMFFKAYRVLAKLVPHKILVRLVKT